MKSPHLLKEAILVSLFLTVVSTATAQTIIVNATSNIFGAGDRPETNPDNPAPAPSNIGGGLYPVFVSVSSPTISVTATGKISVSSTIKDISPDGRENPSTYVFSEFNGISGFTFDHAASLFAVFIGSDSADNYPPASPDLRGIENDLVFSPQLEQIFFIGDGLTGYGTGAVQTIVVPNGATRLYFGFTDSAGSSGALYPGGYGDNTGSLSVTVTAIPEPTFYSVILSVCCLTGMVLMRKRQQLV